MAKEVAQRGDQCCLGADMGVCLVVQLKLFDFVEIDIQVLKGGCAPDVFHLCCLWPRYEYSIQHTTRTNGS